MTSLDLNFENDHILSVCVSLTGPLHTFQSNKRGYTFREHFAWDAKGWRLQFRAFIAAVETETTLGALQEKPDINTVISHSNPLGRVLQILRDAQERRTAGWSLHRRVGGVQGRFDMNRVRVLPSGKIGSFASFNIAIDGTLYLGQFHLLEESASRPKPTAWDRSRGAKAGLPTLGKRR